MHETRRAFAENTQVVTLPSGMKVVLKPDSFAPVVAFQMWVRVGSADETPEQAGMAHILEHMLFKGTARRGVGELARDVEDAGGDINAWTSHDETVFHLIVPAHEFARGLDILADATQHAALDATELARELDVILEEVKRGDDNPGRVLSEELFAAVFAEHPYRKPVIGTEASVRATTREALAAFYRQWYVPENMTFVVVGDFVFETALAAITAAFAAQPEAPMPARRLVSEPAQTAMRVHVLGESVKQAHLALAFPCGTLHDDTLPAWELLSIILGQGESGRLIHWLEREDALVNEIGAYAYTGFSAGLFGIEAELPLKNLEAALDVMLAELARILQVPIPEAELEKAKAMAESDAVYGMQTAQGKARRLGYGQAMTGDVAYLDRYLDRLRATTSADLQAAAARLFAPAQATLVLLWPEEKTAPETARLQQRLAAWTEPTRPVPHEAAAHPAPIALTSGRALPAPDAHGITRVVLPNGVRVLHKAHRTVPLVNMQAGWRAGQMAETEATAGVYNLVSRLLTLGTERLSARDIALAIDRMAGRLDGFSGRMSLGLRGAVLSRHAEEGFALFAECLNAPAFREDEVEKERDVLLEEIAARDEDPAQTAIELFNATLFTRHPFRRPLLGTSETAAGFTSADLARAYEARRAPDGLVVSVVGDIDAEKAVALAEAHFGSWRARALPPLPLNDEPALDSARHAEKLLEREQRHLVLGFFAPSLYDPDRWALDVLNAAISGQGGRLFLHLRDEESLAYSVSSFTMNALDTGVFATYIGTSPEKRARALDGLWRELTRLAAGDLSQGELDYAKRYLIGTHAIGLQTHSAHAAALMLNELYDLGYDEHLRIPDAIRAVTLDDVNRVAQRLITPAAYALAEVGPKEPTHD